MCIRDRYSALRRLIKIDINSNYRLQMERTYMQRREEELLQQIEKIEARLSSSEGLVKLSEEVVRLKSSELETETKIRGEKLLELETRVEKLEKRMDELEICFGGFEEKMKGSLEEVRKSQELTMKRTEISEFMIKKFEIIQNTLEQNEKKIMGAVDKRIEDMGLEADSRFSEIANSIDETGSLVKEVAEKVTVNVESLEKLEDEMLTMMKALNEQAIKLQNVQWMHDELMTIKKRELQIINLLKDQDNVETEFLEQMCSSSFIGPADNF
eukprot:TRINITY_DN2512_c0_g1_i12.p1 TRINITY_DN2512_c0_g1~~TRINITY_DN2512_c0_g1_i12.p1  ORF type:complete len:270 (+),score=110.64 TRINITY_DN2512_c0_g1_i12:73-882(+)